jgi:hypothetical protein
MLRFFLAFISISLLNIPDYPISAKLRKLMELSRASVQDIKQRSRLERLFP